MVKFVLDTNVILEGENGNKLPRSVYIVHKHVKKM